MRPFYCFLISLLSGLCATAQEQLQATVTLADQTVVNGVIWPQDWLSTPQTIQFTDAVTKKTVTYGTDALRAFSVRRQDGHMEYFERRNVALVNRDTAPFAPDIVMTPPRQTMVRLRLRGTPSLYEYTPDVKETHLFIGNDTLTTLMVKEYIRERPGEPNRAMTNLTFRKQLYRAIESCPDMLPAIGKIKHQTSAIQQMLQRYHQCAQIPVEYAWKPEKVRVRWYLEAGTSLGLRNEAFPDAPRSNEQVIATPRPRVGIGAYYALPGVNKRIGLYGSVAVKQFRGTLVSKGIKEILEFEERATAINIHLLPRYYFLRSRAVGVYGQVGAYTTLNVFNKTIRRFKDTNGQVTYQEPSTVYGKQVGGSFAYGAGVNWWRIQVEIRKDANNPAIILDNKGIWSAIIAYRL